MKNNAESHTISKPTYTIIKMNYDFFKKSYKKYLTLNAE